MISKTTAIVGALLLTNAFAGVMWWRSQQETQFWMNESRTLSKQHDAALKENESLQELIMSQRVSSLKLSALNNTTLGKCVSEHPTNAQDYCVGPERVIKGYQKALNSSRDGNKMGSLIRGLTKACTGREGADTSTQCLLRIISLKSQTDRDGEQ